MDNLSRKGIPESVLEGLNSLENQKFGFEDKFLEAVEHEIGKDQTARHKNVILQQAENKVHRIEIDFENYPITAMANAIELGNHVLNFVAQASFLKPEQLYKQLELPEGESEIIPPSFSEGNYDEIKARIQNCYEDFVNLISGIESLVTPVLIGAKYNEVSISLLNEITLR